MPRRHAPLSILLAAALATLARGQVEYSLDDGRGNALGPAFDEWDMVFVNAFDARDGGEWITAVRVCWGSARAGIPATVMILDDPDGDGSPADARVRAVAQAATNPAGNGVFLDYTIPGGVRLCGRFFVAARVSLASGGRGVSPARLDWDAVPNAGLAYLAVGSVVHPENFLDLEHLGRAPIFYRMDSFTFPGAWLLRAEGVAPPPCPADFNDDGFTDFFDYDAFVSCFESGVCPPCRDADVNRDGFADFFDYDAFVAAFELGC